jgi:hypothetical protein
MIDLIHLTSTRNVESDEIDTLARRKHSKATKSITFPSAPPRRPFSRAIKQRSRFDSIHRTNEMRAKKRQRTNVWWARRGVAIIEMSNMNPTCNCVGFDRIVLTLGTSEEATTACWRVSEVPFVWEQEKYQEGIRERERIGKKPLFSSIRQTLTMKPVVYTIAQYYETPRGEYMQLEFDFLLFI